MKNCEFCKREFQPKTLKNKNRFCSCKCYWNSKKSGKVYTCGQCKKRFKLNSTRRDFGANKFCSQICYWINKKNDRESLQRLELARKKIKIKGYWKGKKLPYQVWNKGKLRPDIQGENNPNWKGGKGSERKIAMGRIDYILWRTAVFLRDNYTCQMCKQKGGKLQVDHVKPWALYPELRYAIDNGRTLCILCHRKTDTYGDLRNYLIERMVV